MLALPTSEAAMGVRKGYLHLKKKFKLGNMLGILLGKKYGIMQAGQHVG